MTGKVINRNVNTDGLSLYSGASWNSGGVIAVYGKDNPDSDSRGRFICHSTDGTKGYDLVGSPTGSLTWGGKQVATESDLSNYLPRVDTGYKTISGNGQYLWCKFATITIKYGYVNCPICFEVSGRGISKSNLQVLFQNTDSSDPGLNLFTSDNDTNFYIKKVSTSTWELYYSYNGSWGSLTVYRVVNGVNGSIAINTTLVNLETEPTDKIQCTLRSEGIEEQGDGYIRYASGLQICWGTGSWVTPVATITYPKTFINDDVFPTVCYGSDYNSEHYLSVVNGSSNKTSFIVKDSVMKELGE